MCYLFLCAQFLNFIFTTCSVLPISNSNSFVQPASSCVLLLKSNETAVQRTHRDKADAELLQNRRPQLAQDLLLVQQQGAVRVFAAAGRHKGLCIRRDAHGAPRGLEPEGSSWLLWLRAEEGGRRAVPKSAHVLQGQGAVQRDRERFQAEEAHSGERGGNIYWKECFRESFKGTCDRGSQGWEEGKKRPDGLRRVTYVYLLCFLQL